MTETLDNPRQASMGAIYYVTLMAQINKVTGIKEEEILKSNIIKTDNKSQENALVVVRGDRNNQGDFTFDVHQTLQ